jgi:Tripartite tricarboxylate transporter TctB family
MLHLHKLHKDLWGGALMVAIGGWVVLQTALNYPIGTLQRMGPGYFPLVLGIILIATGLYIAGKAFVTGPGRAVMPARQPQWRAWALISLGIAGFVGAADYLGLVPAAFTVVFIAALGDRGNSWRSAALLALGIVVVAAVVFWWGLQVQLPLLRSPLS